MCKRLPEYKRLGWTMNGIINSCVSRVSVCLNNALVNVKLRHKLGLRFFLSALPRVELPIAMLT